MNLDRYEKIDGWQALERLKKNEGITREIDGMFFEFERMADSVFETEAGENDFDISDIVLNEFLETDWYIPKPFDVRQVMLDRPNEWVGAYNDERGKWIQVGFDSVSMRPIKAYHGYTGLVEGAKAQQATSFELDNCILIEDVPGEATR